MYQRGKPAVHTTTLRQQRQTDVLSTFLTKALLQILRNEHVAVNEGGGGTIYSVPQ